MKVLLKMIAALLITKAKLIGPGGTEAFVTDSRHIKQQIPYGANIRTNCTMLLSNNIVDNLFVH